MTHKLEYDAQTGQTVTRELNVDEQTQRTTDIAKHVKLTQMKLDRVKARQAVLDKLGLTADEAAALFG